jgi:hypothetical protein
MIKAKEEGKVRQSIFWTFHIILESKQVSENLAIFLISTGFIQLIVMTANQNN